MREYRGKRIDNGEWVFGSLISDRYIVGEVVEWNDEYFNTEWWCAVDPDTVGQYIGLKDRNGKNAHEGDLCAGGNKLYEIVWIGESAMYGVRLHKSDHSLGRGATFPIWQYLNDDTGMLKFEIVGNRWDHPHLLGEDSK